MREESVVTAEPGCDPVDCGANYDGKHSSAVLGVGAGIVAAAAGTPSSSTPAIGSRRRKRRRTNTSSTSSTSEPNSSPAKADMVDETGFGFYYQPNFNPGIQGPLRPARSDGRPNVRQHDRGTRRTPTFTLGSFYHLAFAKKLTDTITESERLDYSRAIFFPGMEGYDDIRRIYEGRGVGSRRRRRCGFLRGLRDRNGELRHGDGGRRPRGRRRDADSASITEAVLSGEREDTSPTPLSSTARSECMPARMSIASRTDSSGHASHCRRQCGSRARAVPAGVLSRAV